MGPVEAGLPRILHEEGCLPSRVSPLCSLTSPTTPLAPPLLLFARPHIRRRLLAITRSKRVADCCRQNTQILSLRPVPRGGQLPGTQAGSLVAWLGVEVPT
eukprot:2582887-Rhodomonas_salina.1